MIGVYVLGVPLIVIALTVTAIGASIGYFCLDLSRTAKMAFVVGAALIFGGLAASAFAQTTQAEAKGQAKPLGAATIHGRTGWQTEGRGHGAAIASVELRQLRSGR